jgi:hypothetical protein
MPHMDDSNAPLDLASFQFGDLAFRIDYGVALSQIPSEFVNRWQKHCVGRPVELEKYRLLAVNELLPSFAISS